MKVRKIELRTNSFRSLVILLVVLFVAACSGGYNAPTPTAPVPDPVAAKVTIAPGSVTLLALDETDTLSAIVEDENGAQIDKNVVWTSNDPVTVSVDANGLLTAMGVVGSAAITAEVDGVQSSPVTVLVALAVPGVLIVEDSQVTGNFELVDPASDLVIGDLYKVTLTGIGTPAIGTILLGRGDAPVGGEVMAVEVINSDITVTLRLLPLNQVFSELTIDEIYDLSNEEPQISDLTAQYYSMARQSDGTLLYTLKEATAVASTGPSKFNAGAVADEFLIAGPFECETSATELPFTMNVLPAEVPVDLNLNFVLDYHLPDGNELKKIALEGSAEVAITLKPSFNAALEAKIECLWEMGVINVPIGGYLSLFLGGQIPYGTGFELGGKVTAASFGLELFAKSRADLELGLACPAGGGDCTGIHSVIPTSEADYKWILPDPANLDSQLRLEPTAFGFVYAKVAVGNKFFDSVRLEAFIVKVGLAQTANLAMVIAQIVSSDYASDYKLTTDLVVGLASDALTFLTKIGVNVTNFGFKTSAVLDESPKATSVTVDFAKYVAGDTLSFKVKLNPLSTDYFPIAYNVDDIIIYRKLDLGGGLVGASEVARTTAFALQDDFTLTWDADADGNGTDNFYAFVDSKVLFLPFFDELELKKAAVLDTDSDGMPDGWELKYGLDPGVSSASNDGDADDLGDLNEYLDDTDPTNPDTEGDGMPDGWEVSFELDPLADDSAQDPDMDGLTNLEEYLGGTNPLIPEGTAGSPPRILFTSFRDGNDEIYVMDADGANQTNLSNDPGNDQSPAAAEDGTRIAFVSDRDGNKEIYAADADGSNTQRLTNYLLDDDQPSWSPDGTRIAFVRRINANNEIYVMAADGSNLQQLTNNAASDNAPFWSPDGTRIVFWSDRTGNPEIFVMNADGSNALNLSNNVRFDTNPSWSPDGTRIAFVSNRDFNFEIYVMNDDGTNQQNVSNNPSSDSNPSWSPDATTIAFDSFRDGNLEVHVMNADGSNPQNLSNDVSSDYNPAWTKPINPKIAFVSNRDGNTEIFAMNPDGTDPTRLTFDDAEDSGPSVSPDTTKIAFVSHRDGNYEIYVMDASGASPTNLTNSAGTEDFFPAWSPDGGTLLFERKSEIYSMNSDGTNQVNLTNDPANTDQYPVWSPDGTKIVFVSTRDGNLELYSMNPDGTGQVNLTNSPDTDQYPSWSPDGSRLSFMSMRDGRREIYVMNADGTSPIKLSNNPGTGTRSLWSQDGSKIFFEILENGNWDIYSMNPQGNNQLNLTDIPGADLTPTRSPDGAKILFNSSRDGNLEIYDMDFDGGNQRNLTMDLGSDFF